MGRVWILGVVFVVILLQSCASMKIPTIYDAKKYGAKEVYIASAKNSLVFSQSKMPDDALWMPANYLKKYNTLDNMLAESNTTAFVVLKDGKVLYEKYFNGIEQGDLTQIFSITKVVTTSILGIALQEGKIQSLDQPVSDFIPEFKEEGLDKITLYHLAQMQSGLDYDEYSRLLQTLKFYHKKDINPVLRAPKIKAEAGTEFKYKSIDTQILGECIEKAVGIPFLDYINEKLFSKLGFEDPVMWSVDSEESGNLKYYGGLNISARDLAKFGALVANSGVLKNEQVLSPNTVSFCGDISCRNMKDNYCNGWWYDTWDEQTNVFFGAGFRGQILMINKTDNVVIVRLGESKGGIKWYDMLKELSVQIGEAGFEHILNEDFATK